MNQHKNLHFKCHKRPTPLSTGEGLGVRLKSKKTRLSARFRFLVGGRTAARPDLDICESAVWGVKGTLLVVDIPAHLSHVLRKANNLLGVAKLVVVPNIEHHTFPVG